MKKITYRCGTAPDSHRSSPSPRIYEMLQYQTRKDNLIVQKPNVKLWGRFTKLYAAIPLDHEKRISHKSPLTLHYLDLCVIYQITIMRVEVVHKNTTLYHIITIIPFVIPAGRRYVS